MLPGVRRSPPALGGAVFSAPAFRFGDKAESTVVPALRERPRRTVRENGEHIPES